MKRIPHALIGLIFCTCLTHAATPAHRDATKEIEALATQSPVVQPVHSSNVPPVLQAFLAGIVAPFGNILANPHDNQVVGPNLAHMFGGIIQFVAEATRKRGHLRNGADLDEIFDHLGLTRSQRIVFVEEFEHCIATIQEVMREREAALT